MTVPQPSVAVSMPTVPMARTVLPAAVSPLVSYVVSGPARPARVLAAFDTAVYLTVPGLDEVVLPLLTADALPLPTGLRLTQTSAEVVFGLAPGDTVVVGEGTVRWRHMTVRAVRVWRPARVALRPGASARLSSPEVRRLLAGAAGDGRSVLGGLTAALVREIRRGGDASPYLLGLVGRGAGLTPSGDDALIGALLALAALAQPLPSPFGLAYARTTSLSASLLRAAGEGYAIAAVVRLTDAAIAGDLEGCRDVLPGVLAIGHSSGADLVAGLLGALRALGAPDTPGLAPGPDSAGRS